ncbi:energy transducer TonB [Roseovarius nitratireducens]|uniref:energy transducer TonB n=1 Tax=Roseovarius nitratireducens TaxID=2044597 RepID=UPI00101AD939|nr:energy transducer TonB [Roseovarius nitratireducens]
MNTGQIISGTAHLAVIGWVFFGGVLQSDPPQVEVVEAVAVSSEEYAAIMARQSAPEAAADVDTPEPPEAGEAAPALSSGTDAAPEVNRPEVSDTPPPDARPEAPERPAPAPTDVTDTPPALTAPSEDTAALVPETSLRPQPRPAPRVAPEPVAPSEPDVRVDDVARPEVAPEEGADAVEDQQEATAPEEATTEIVTEAERPETPVPTASVRPRARPTRLAEAEADTETATAPPEPTPPEPTPPDTDRDAVSDALAAALGQDSAPAERRPSGPPLSAGEKDALRVAVQQCWNVGSLSSDALATTVVVAVSMAETGKPEMSSIRMLSHTGGSASAAQQAYEAARRAIIRCGADGFDLPQEKYAQWRDIEMTFNPEKMRIK